MNASKQGFDKSSATMGSVFRHDDDSNNLFLFYTGAQDGNWSRSTVGLAKSKNGVDFERNREDPIMEESSSSFCSVQAFNPVVTKVKNRFFMVLSGRCSFSSSRKIGIAYADDLAGPWHVIGELVKPSFTWEGNAIDNGCSVVKLDEETLIVYYSSLTSRKLYDFPAFLRRYPVRRIGLLKVHIRGISRSSIEAMRYSGNPLKHLNGPKGSWNESVFCPGYFRLHDKHIFFPAASTYSVGFPWKQYLGVGACNSPFFEKGSMRIEKLIEGPLEKAEIMPDIKGEMALDTPSPYFNQAENRLFLYYSVADRADGIWKIALTTFGIS